MSSVNKPVIDSSDSDSVNTTQCAASIDVPPPISNNDDIFLNTVKREDDPLQVRRTLLASKDSLTIPRDLLPEKKADVIRPRRQLDVPALVETLSTGRDLRDDSPSAVKVVALVDSGCTSSVMDKTFAKLHGFNAKPLSRSIPVKNADSSTNWSGYNSAVSQCRERSFRCLPGTLRTVVRIRRKSCMSHLESLGRQGAEIRCWTDFLNLYTVLLVTIYGNCIVY